MRKNLVIMFAALLLVYATTTWAHKKRSTAAVASHSLEAIVTYGERVSTFQVDKNGQNYHLHFFNNTAEDRQIQISDKNFSYLTSELQGVSEAASDNSHCPRSNISVVITQGGVRHSYFSCLEEHSREAKQLSHLVNLLTLML